MGDDLARTAGELRAKGVRIDGEPEDSGWGVHVTMVLPGGRAGAALRAAPRHRH